MAMIRCGIVSGSYGDTITRRRNRSGMRVRPDNECSYFWEDEDEWTKREHGCVEKVS